MKKYILAYGSLKKNCYNFDRFGKNSQKYIKTFQLDGYEMYDLGFYPAIMEGKGTITVELHEVTPEAFKGIRWMESGAGYKEKQIEIDGIKASIYYFDKLHLTYFSQKGDKIESGNWMQK